MQSAEGARDFRSAAQWLPLSSGDRAVLERYIDSKDSAWTLDSIWPNGEHKFVTQRSLSELLLRGFYAPAMLDREGYLGKRVLNVGAGYAVYDAQRLLQDIDWYALDFPEVIQRVVKDFPHTSQLKERFIGRDFLTLTPGTQITPGVDKFDLIESTYSLFHYLALSPGELLDGDHDDEALLRARADNLERNTAQLVQAMKNAAALLKDDGELRVSPVRGEDKFNLQHAAQQAGLEMVRSKSGSSTLALIELEKLLNADPNPWLDLVVGKSPYSASSTQTVFVRRATTERPYSKELISTREAALRMINELIERKTAPEYMTFRREREIACVR